jgi:threonine/homoserine/homoserine lactone efflux protein
MPAPHTLAVFALAAFVLIVIPGPGVIYVVTRSIEHGRTAGLISALGVDTGNLTHALAAAVGLSALVASSAEAFTIVKFAGAGYLIYLGIRALSTSGDQEVDEPADAGRSWRTLFLWGYLVELLNPKTALFFLAFLPQFADPARGSVGLQIMILGICFTGIAVVSDCTYAFLAGAAGRRLRRWWDRRRIDRASGVIYIGLGLLAAFSHGRPTRD